MSAIRVACPLCGADDDRPRFEKAGWSIVECRRCGLVYVNPRPDRPDRIYTGAYFEDERYYASYQASRHAYRIGFRTKLRTLRRLGLAGRLLDVGCAFGDFMDEARAHGFDPSGVELCASAAAEAARVGPVHAGPFLEFRSDRPFDVVTFVDTLEHLPDPVAAVRHAASLLAPGGAVAVVVPNVGSRFARWMGTRWHLLLPEEHLVYFDRRTIRRLLEGEGFSIVHEGTAGYGRTLGEILSVLLRGTGWGPRLVRGPLRRIAFEVDLGDLFVVARR